MKRWLPYPAMTAFIAVVWLLLNQSLAAGHILVGVGLGVVLSRFMRRLELPPLKMRRLHVLLILAARVAGDVVRSNIAVLGIILSGKRRQVRSGFVRVPLVLTNGYGLAVLACIITSTPGTIWMSYEAKERVLLIHVFDLVDEEVWIRTIRDRYETPLREVFQ